MSCIAETSGVTEQSAPLAGMTWLDTVHVASGEEFSPEARRIAVDELVRVAMWLDDGSCGEDTPQPGGR